MALTNFGGISEATAQAKSHPWEMISLIKLPLAGYWVDYSPSTDKIAFVRKISPSKTTLWVTKPDGGGNFQVSSFGPDDGPPSWSPDGTQIVFSANKDEKFSGIHSIWMVKNDGTELHVIGEKQDYEDLTYPTYSPDGKLIAFRSSKGAREKDPLHARYPGSLWVTTTDGKTTSELSTISVDGWVEKISWSPDSRKIAFLSNRYDGTASIVVIDIESKQRRELTPFGYYFSRLSWAPDGTKIAAIEGPSFSVLNPNGTKFATLLIFDLKNGKKSMLQHGEGIKEPQFLQNGDGVAYLTNGEIRSIDLKDGIERKVLTGKNFVEFVISPDNKKIIAVAKEGKEYSIWVATFK